MQDNSFSDMYMSKIFTDSSALNHFWQVIEAYAPSVKKRVDELKGSCTISLHIEKHIEEFIDTCALTPSEEELKHFNSLYEIGILRTLGFQCYLYFELKRDIMNYIVAPLENGVRFPIVRGPIHYYSLYWEPLFSEYWNLSDEEIEQISSHFSDIKEEIQQELQEKLKSKINPSIKGFIDWKNQQVDRLVNIIFKPEYRSERDVWVDFQITLNHKAIESLTRSKVVKDYIAYFKYKIEEIDSYTNSDKAPKPTVKPVAKKNLSDYLTKEGKWIEHFLIKHLTNAKPKKLTPFLFALQDLGLITDAFLSTGDQTCFHEALAKALGDIGHRQAFNISVNNYNAAEQRHEESIKSAKKKVLQWKALVTRAL